MKNYQIEEYKMRNKNSNVYSTSILKTNITRRKSRKASRKKSPSKNINKEKV